MCEVDNAVIAEYETTRSEIVQLNKQRFSIVVATLVFNMTILGWVFERTDPTEYYWLPLFASVVLFVGLLFSFNRGSLAHRLATFQEVFIESRLSGIRWCGIYCKYVDKLDGKAVNKSDDMDVNESDDNKHGKIHEFIQRIARKFHEFIQRTSQIGRASCREKV